MDALSAAASWDAEDDVLLKSAVEAGASLESLAKGAVCFSRNFTLQELQDRWCSLLYDSEISAQASARIVKYETELSTFNPAKDIKLFNSKGKFFPFRKRKIDSVKSHYYAMRKRVWHEPCLSADFGYIIAPCSCSPLNTDCICGGLKPSKDQVHKIDPEVAFVDSYGHIGESHAGRQDIHPKENGHYILHTKHGDASGSMVIDENIHDKSLCGSSDSSQLYFDGCAYIQRNTLSSQRNRASKDILGVQDYVQPQQNLLGDYCDNGVTGSKTLLDTDQGDVEHNQFYVNNKGGLHEPSTVKAIGKHLCSWAHSSHTWSNVEAVNSPGTLTDMHIKDQELLSFSDDKKLKTTNSDELSFQEKIDSGVFGSGLGDAIISEGDLMGSCSMGFSHKENIELLNGKNTLDSSLDTNQEDAGDPRAEVFPQSVSRVHHLYLSVISNAYGNYIDPIPKKHNVADVSRVGMIPTSSEVPFRMCRVECRLNTEDSEIPCIDDMLIPGQAPLECTSTCDHNSQHNMCLVSTECPPPQNADNFNHTDLVEDIQPSSLPIKLEPSNLEQMKNMVALNEACIIGSKSPAMHGNIGANNANLCMPTSQSAAEFVEESTCGLVQHAGLESLQNLNSGMSIHAPNQMASKFLADKLEIGCETSIQNCILSHTLLDVEFYNPMVTMSTPSQAEESDNDSSIPNFLDIQALILDQDLIPWHQESDFIQPEVSRFQHLEYRRDLVRLERGARSSKNRSIISQGAFAILYGQHLKYYMKNFEVILGRETGEVHVDIDLCKEGKANKISRRQAIITMDESGSFHIKNIGKFPIFVNGIEVPCNKRINLISNALLEVRGMKFIFHINPDAVKQHVVRAGRGSSRGRTTAFDWDQNP